MKIESKKDACRVTMVVNASAEEIREDYDKVVKAFIKDAPIPGFRPGKAPLSVIKNRYGKEMQREIESRLISHLLPEAIEQEKLDKVRVVDLSGVVCTAETGISFSCVVDVKPEFKLPKYQKLPVSVNSTEIEQEKVDDYLKMIRRSYAKSEETEEAAKDGDYLEVSFEATSGGKAIEGIPEESSRYIKSDKFWFTAGEKPEHESIPGSSKAMLGLKKGDDFAFDTKFPNDFMVEALRKVKATYTGKVISVRAMIEPTDDELIKACYVDSMEQLNTKTREMLQKRADDEEKTRLTTEISALLIKKASFDVPESDVQIAASEHVEEIARKMAQDAKVEDINAYVSEHKDEIRKAAEEKALDDVRLRYIVAGIAEEQGIKVVEKDINDELASAVQYMAMRDPKSKLTVAKLREQLEESGRIAMLVDQILKTKVIDWIIADIKAGK